MKIMKKRLDTSDLGLALGAAALLGAGAGAAVSRFWRDKPELGTQPNRHTRLPQLDNTPRRRYYTGHDISRAAAIADLRAMTHKRLPRFALEYLEGGSEDEATMERERRAYADWRFMPRTLVDVSHRDITTTLFGKPASMPLVVAPTGLNGVYRRHADTELARGAAKVGVPFVQSTMSNDSMFEVAKVPGLRHWWQLYVFGGDEIWQELLRRADQAGCEALVLTTNTQIFGNREWEKRTRATQNRLTVPAAMDSLLHPIWFAETLSHGIPTFKNVIEFVPKGKRSLFEASHWIRQHQPTSLSWDTVAKIRQFWKKPFLLKGILNLEDVRRAVDSGVDGVVLSSHGGRQLDWTVAPLDLLPKARQLIKDRMALFIAGGVRRGTDILKAVGLGADAVFAGRAPLYGVCAAGSKGVERALHILHHETYNSLGLLGAKSLADLGPDLLTPARALGSWDDMKL